MEVSHRLARACNNNLMVRSEGVPYVFKDLKEGTAVVRLVEDKWVKVGRITKYKTIESN